MTDHIAQRATADEGVSQSITQEVSEILSGVKSLARQYYRLTGKSLGVTGEIAKNEACRLLGLAMADARQANWDAVGVRPDGAEERLQIKGRCFADGVGPRARLGRIDISKEFDAVLLVLLDDSFMVLSIHRVERSQIVEALTAPGSRAREVRGQLSVSKFTSIGAQIWPPQKQADNRITSVDHANDWLFTGVVETLQQDGFLTMLCQPKRSTEAVALREKLIESQLESLATTRFGDHNVFCRRRLQDAVPGVEPVYPATAKPDLVVHCDGSAHILEIKSNRTDYQREDREIGVSIGQHLKELGHDGPAPWEVEQDLIKLTAMRAVSGQISRCTLLIVDAYAGSKWSWTSVFSNAETFRAHMKTDAIRARASEIVLATTIKMVSDGRTQARLIVCEV